MIVDTSVFVAISLEEKGYLVLFDFLDSAGFVGVPSSVVLETSMVLKYRKGLQTALGFENILERINATILTFDARTAFTARDAFLKYGKGQGHKAQLNFGDCMVYAAAKSESLPLLYVGDDFAHTDIESASGYTSKSV